MQKTVETIQNKILRGSELQEFAKQFNTKIQGDVKTKFDELGTASTKNAGNEAGQLPVIGEDGKLSTSILPSIAINDTFVVASEEEAMQQVVEVGDVVIINNEETSESTTYICVDLGEGLDTTITFDGKFRPLLSNSDSISKADLEAGLALKADKTSVEEIKTNLEGSIASAVTKAEDELNAYKLVVDGEISNINTSILDAKSELQANIDTKVSQVDYDTKVEEIENEIATKVAISDYDVKVAELEASIDTKLTKTDYIDDLKEVAKKIDEKVAQADYDVKIASIESEIATKVDSTEYASDKSAMETKVSEKATQLVIENDALKLKTEDGTELSSLNFINTEDIKNIIDAL